MNIQTKIILLGFSYLVILFIYSSPVYSLTIQKIEIPSTLNPVGSGARAFGMGGAYIAIADDATAASWNPAALINLERTEISLVVTNYHRVEDNSFGTNPQSNGKQSISKNSLNYFSLAYPLELSCFNRTYPIVFSLNYQNLYNFDREWHLPFFIQADNFVLNQNANFLQTGNLSAIGLAGSVEIIAKVLSVGLTINIWSNELTTNHWEKKIYQKGTGTNEGHDFTFTYTSINDYEFKDFNYNFNLGALWKKDYSNHSVTIGAVIKTPFSADVIRKSKYKSSFHYIEKDEPEPNSFISNVYNESLDFPLSYGVGAAFLFGRRNNFKVDFDLYVTEWKDYIIPDAIDRENPNDTDKTYHDDKRTVQVRLGMEYLFFKDKYFIPFRTGLFYDPVPGDDCIDDYFGFTLGSGFHKENIQLDFGYQYRFGNNVSKYIYKSLNFSQDIKDHTFCVSLIYRL